MRDGGVFLIGSVSLRLEGCSITLGVRKILVLPRQVIAGTEVFGFFNMASFYSFWMGEKFLKREQGDSGDKQSHTA